MKFRNRQKNIITLREKLEAFLFSPVGIRSHITVIVLLIVPLIVLLIVLLVLLSIII